MEWLKTSLLVFILFIFAVNNVNSSPLSAVTTQNETKTTVIPTRNEDQLILERVKDMIKEMEKTGDIIRVTSRPSWDNWVLGQPDTFVLPTWSPPKAPKPVTYAQPPPSPEYDTYVPSRTDRTTNRLAATRKPTTTTEKTTTTTVKEENVRKSNSDYSGRNSIKFTTPTTTTTTESEEERLSGEFKVTWIAYSIISLVGIPLVIFAAFMYGRRMKFYEEMHEREFGQFQMGYNSNQPNNITPTRTATATLSAATSRTTNEAVSNTEANAAASKEELAEY